MQRDYVYQGIIVDAAEEDSFYEVATNQKVYFTRRKVDDRVEWRFAIVTDRPLPKNCEIRVRYLNQQAISEGALGNPGGDAITLKIPDRNKHAFSFQIDKNKGAQLVALAGVNI